MHTVIIKRISKIKGIHTGLLVLHWFKGHQSPSLSLSCTKSEKSTSCRSWNHKPYVDSVFYRSHDLITKSFARWLQCLKHSLPHYWRAALSPGGEFQFLPQFYFLACIFSTAARFAGERQQRLRPCWLQEKTRVPFDCSSDLWYIRFVLLVLMYCSNSVWSRSFTFDSELRIAVLPMDEYALVVTLDAILSYRQQISSIWQ